MGDRHEREMVNEFRKAGWGAMRCPSSGSATEWELPDVLASDHGRRTWAIEEKYRTANRRCYVGAEEVEALRTFAEAFGATVVFAIRFSTRLEGVEDADWFLVDATAVPQTDAERYKFHHESVKEFPTLGQVV